MVWGGVEIIQRNDKCFKSFMENKPETKQSTGKGVIS